jgi:KDO2-lipid IV(A) lauroyltransferase
MEQRIIPIHDRFGYVASVAGIKISQLLGPIYASNVFGAIARMIGPHLSVSRVADQNLHAAMPELSYAERCRIIRLVWENLGRTIGELPHLSKLDSTSSGPGFEISGAEHLSDLGEGPVIFVSAHIGNWEAFPPIAARNGVVASSIYRAASNPLIDRLTLGLRRAGVRTHLPLFAKGAAGSRNAYKHLVSGGRLGMVVDQKLNEGVEARLFGMRAMTSSAAAMLALKLKCKIVPGHVDRIGPARLRLTLEAPLCLPDTSDRKADILSITQSINDRIEVWVRDNPGQWLWLHRRWSRDVINSQLNL